MEFADDLNDSLDVLDWRLGQNAVSEIDDVPGPCAGSAQKIGNLGAKLRQGCEKRDRIQIALNGGTVADVHPRLVDIDAPVDADDIAAGGVQFAEKSARTRTEVNNGNAGGANAFDQSARIGLNEADVIFGAERAHPAIEDLNGARAGADLQTGKVCPRHRPVCPSDGATSFRCRT